LATKERTEREIQNRKGTKEQGTKKRRKEGTKELGTNERRNEGKKEIELFLAQLIF
jgi:hypothetical protein